MALLPVTMCGDKILRKKTSKVTEVDNETIELITNMFDTGVGKFACLLNENI